jgi:hypothetical protein
VLLAKAILMVPKAQKDMIARLLNFRRRLRKAGRGPASARTSGQILSLPFFVGAHGTGRIALFPAHVGARL